MKKLLLLIALFISCNLSAQYLFQDNNKYNPKDPFLKCPEVYVPLSTLAGTFVINQNISSNSNLTSDQKTGMITRNYFVGCALTAGLHYGIKYIKNNRKQIKRRLKR